MNKTGRQRRPLQTVALLTYQLRLVYHHPPACSLVTSTHSPRRPAGDGDYGGGCGAEEEAKAERWVSLILLLGSQDHLLLPSPSPFPLLAAQPLPPARSRATARAAPQTATTTAAPRTSRTRTTRAARGTVKVRGTAVGVHGGGGRGQEAALPSLSCLMTYTRMYVY